eukprot:1486704-Pyramimonas_sp.AAC.1
MAEAFVQLRKPRPRPRGRRICEIWEARVSAFTLVVADALQAFVALDSAAIEEAVSYAFVQNQKRIAISSISAAICKLHVVECGGNPDEKFRDWH